VHEDEPRIVELIAHSAASDQPDQVVNPPAAASSGVPSDTLPNPETCLHGQF
jgi:hypothetical protein